MKLSGRHAPALWALAALCALLGAIGLPGGGTEPPRGTLLIDLSRSHWPADRATAEARLAAVLGDTFARRAPRVVAFGERIREAPEFSAGAGAPLARAIVRWLETVGAQPAERTHLPGRTALAALDPDGVIWLVSDGRHATSGLLEGAGLRAFRHLGALTPEPADVRIALAAPAPRLVPGSDAEVLVRLTSTATEEREVVIGVSRSVELEGGLDAEVAGDTITTAVAKGASTTLPIRLQVAPDARSMILRLLAVDGPDASVSNDVLRLPVTAPRRPRVRIMAPSDLVAPLAATLDAGRWNVLAASGPEWPAPQELQTLDLLVVHEVDLEEGASVLEALPGAVRSEGLGLLLLGGPGAFRGGGWAGTSLGRLSPLDPRPPSAEELHVLLDASGSMAQDARLARAVVAIRRLAQGLGAETRLQVHPFARDLTDPIPSRPVAGGAFVAAASAALAALKPGGPTRLVEALEGLEPGGGEAGKRGLVVLADLEDPALADAEARAALRERLAARFGAGVVVVLLDPDEARRAIARDLAERVHEARVGIVPRLLLEGLATEPWFSGAIRVQEGDVTTERYLGFSRTLARTGPLLETVGGEPLIATWIRGGGRVTACALDAARDPEARGWLPELATRTARREAGWRALWREGRLHLEAPRGGVVPSRIGVQLAGRDETPRIATERAPGRYELMLASPPGGFVHVLRTTGARVASIPVIAGGDAEYQPPRPRRLADHGSLEVASSPPHRTVPLVLALGLALLAILRAGARPVGNPTSSKR